MRLHHSTWNEIQKIESDCGEEGDKFWSIFLEIEEKMESNEEIYHEIQWMKFESGIFFMRLDLMQLELSAERKKREKLMEKSGRWLSLPQRRPCSVWTIKWSITKCNRGGSLQKNFLHFDVVHDDNDDHPLVSSGAVF